MKKRNYFLIGAAGLILASCANDDLMQPASGDIANISISLNTPKLQTRGYADGKSANQLQYAVYEVTGDSYSRVKDPQTVDNFNISTNINLQLSNGHEYAVIFWAGAKDNSPYSVDYTESGASMTVDYEKTKANDANLDAFYVCHNLGTINGDRQVNVSLTRPFAQINIGTDDYDKVVSENDVPNQSSIKIDKAPQKLDLVTGEVSDEIDAIFSNNTINKDTEPFPKKEGNYQYLAMAYILVGENTNHEVTFTYDTNAKVLERTVSSVPVQRNHRTNIFGSILTSNQNLVVEVKPGFSDEEDILLTWDGETATYPDVTGNEVSIVQPSDLKGFANMVNGEDGQEASDFSGKTIILENDFDMGGYDFPMIGMATRSGAGAKEDSKIFKGVFDGNGKTISNINITYTEGDKNTIVGFIASLDGNGAVLKDLTFDNLTIDAGLAEQAGVVGTLTGGATVSGVKVMSGSIKSTEAAGGIVGRLMKDGTVENCENHANVSATAHNVGGIVGAAYYLEAGKTMKVDNCSNYGEVSGKYGVGGVIGLSCAEVTGCTNYGDKVTGTTASVGGVVGEQKATGKIENCTNYADIEAGDGGTANYGAGGIVGWVRYSTEAAYPTALQNKIVVSGCVNNGKHIKGATGVGGIVGTWYSDGECKENKNYAETITADGNFAAGIVGNSQWTEVASDGSNKNGYSDAVKLTVHDNISYTTKANIKAAGCMHEYVYINNSEKTTQENNSNPAVVEVSSTNGLSEALSSAEKGSLIKLTSGTYTMPSKMTPGVILEGNGNTVIDLTNSQQRGGYNDVTFKNMKVKFQQGDYNGITGSDNVTFENCVIEGQPFSYASNVKYLKCTFNQTEPGKYNIWAYTSTPVTFTDCIFNSAGKALLIYNEGGITDQTVYINNCKFYASQPANDGKAAIEIDSRFCNINVYINNCTSEGFDLGSVSQNTLWNVKKEEKTANVYVNDQKVH